MSYTGLAQILSTVYTVLVFQTTSFRMINNALYIKENVMALTKPRRGQGRPMPLPLFEPLSILKSGEEPKHDYMECSLF